MRFIVTEKDLQDNPILVIKGFKAGDSCETTDFVQPTLNLNPPAQDRERTPEVKIINIPETVEETVDGDDTGEAPKPEPVKKEAAKPAAKNTGGKKGKPTKK